VTAIIECFHAASSYLNLGILTETIGSDISNRAKLSRPHLHSLVLLSDFVIAGAYDGEAEVIWAAPETAHP
jgi:hypothetical protein